MSVNLQKYCAYARKKKAGFNLNFGLQWQIRDTAGLFMYHIIERKRVKGNPEPVNDYRLPVLIILLIFLPFFGCYPTLEKQARHPDEAMIPVRFFYPNLQDDMDIDSLALAVKKNLEYLNRIDQGHIFDYGSRKISCRQVRESQEEFLKLITENSSRDKLYKKIKEHFQFYRAAGRAENNKVLFTGYYEPIFEASLKRDETYKYPIYRKPDDLIKIDLSRFHNKYKGQDIIARIEGKNVLPYYTKHQIDMEKALDGRGLEIAWLRDPVDVTFLQIQGSGKLKFPDGETITVGYEATNGRPYRSIGRYLTDNGLMLKEQLSMQGIRRYFSEYPEIRDEVLSYNPSYVFFRVLEGAPVGNINVPLTPGRSVALDSSLFPKGALAFITCVKPVINDQYEITGWKKFSRFVINQDTGGAIKGAGRADIFWGNGPYAETAAGNMNNEGELYILIRNP